MKRLLTALLFVLVFGTVETPGQSRKIIGLVPRDVVEEVVWNMGVSGELLTVEGWNRASGYYFEPGPIPQDKSFDVISNNYGFYSVSIDDDKAEVEMGFTDAGRVDSSLRYFPPRPTHAYKTNMGFRLVLTPGGIRNFAPDGKTELPRTLSKDWIWQIEGPLKRWTTVNTAVRYVLEMRDKTANPVIKKNADETIAKLLKWH